MEEIINDFYEEHLKKYSIYCRDIIISKSSKTDKETILKKLHLKENGSISSPNPNNVIFSFAIPIGFFFWH